MRTRSLTSPYARPRPLAPHARERTHRHVPSSPAPEQADPDHVEPTRNPETRPRHNLVEIATRLAEQHELWEPLVRYDPISRYYARLANEPDFEAWLLTWVPGQGTDWHDHGGSAGAFVVVRGDAHRAHRDGEPGRAAADRADEPRVLTDGSLRAFGTKHIHRVTNNGLEPAVSVHVYSPALVEMNSYAEDGPRLWQTGSQLIGVNW